MGSIPETRLLLTDSRESWLTIWFNRPQARNALSREMAGELSAVLHAVREDESIRGITLRGKGGAFCAGGDIKGFKAVFQEGAQSIEEVARSSREGGELFDLLNELPKVVVMLVEGAAMAGGLGIMCAGDVVAVTADAQFAITETTLGIPPAQIAPFVAQRIGMSVARRLMLTAARFDGIEAGRIGLADHVAKDVADLEAFETRVRKQVLQCAPGAIAATKGVLLASRFENRETMLDVASEAFARCMLSEEGREGVSAFVEKRKPRWTNV